ncbi:VOC family protein [Parafrankia elaeagni]|uniref:VOC family protein n=1 Tax=Parafrankia elaeagni TaxID=222534 RepID=UPI0003758C6A|nr:VOC family protein [Parafrankia elaeagni]
MDILGIGYVGVESPTFKEWATFGPEVLGLGLADPRPDDETIYLRMDDRRYRIAVHPGETDKISYFGWELTGRRAYDEALATLEKAGVDVELGGEELAEKRGVMEVARFKDPAGYQNEIFYGLKYQLHSFLPGRPHSGFLAGLTGVGHLVLTMPEYPVELDHFLSEVMGFRLFGHGHNGKRGQIGFWAASLNPTSHNVAYAVIPGHHGIHHIGIAVKDLDDVGIAQDLALERGHGIHFSLGRHNQDPVYSVYLKTPSGFGIEYLSGGLEDGGTPVFSELNPEELSVWGHKAISPELPKSVRPVGG